jgi:hypothetical protein
MNTVDTSDSLKRYTNLNNSGQNVPENGKMAKSVEIWVASCNTCQHRNNPIIKPRLCPYLKATQGPNAFWTAKVLYGPLGSLDTNMC